MNIHAVTSDAEVQEAISILRLKKSERACRLLANNLETALELRKPKEYTSSGFRQNEGGRSINECRAGGFQNALQSNKEAITRNVEPVIRFFVKEGWDTSLPAIIRAAERFGTNRRWMEHVATLAKSTEERINALLAEKAGAEADLDAEFDRLDSRNASYNVREERLAPLRSRIDRLTTELSRLGG